MKSYFPLISILFFMSSAYSDHYNFNLYGVSFDYPVGWVVQNQTSSSVSLSIATNRSLYIEILPDAIPVNYIYGKLSILDSLFLNMKGWGRGTVDIGNHWGYWVGTTQASKTTFLNFHTNCAYVRFPKIQRVLVCQYTNEYSAATYYQDDMAKIQVLYSTFAVQSDNIPNRTNCTMTTSSYNNLITSKYPANFIASKDSSIAYKYEALDLYDMYDEVFQKMRFQVTTLSPQANLSTLFDAELNLFKVLDTIMNKSDTFAVISDSSFQYGKYAEYVYGQKEFPRYTYYFSYADAGHQYTIWYRGHLVDLERSEIINLLIQNCTFNKTSVRMPVKSKQTNLSPINLRVSRCSGYIQIAIDPIPKTNEPATLSLYSINGRKVCLKAFNLLEEIKIPVSTLSNQQYFVNIHSKSISVSQLIYFIK